MSNFVSSVSCRLCSRQGETSNEWFHRSQNNHLPAVAGRFLVSTIQMHLNVHLVVSNCEKARKTGR